MNQPQLGKKIAELRKAKGLTQEELVALCNLNVRTLQRIESGEVTPRSYTIKIIFIALDYDFYDTRNDTTDSTDTPEAVTSPRLEQIYRYVLDLLNFKKNTMKKLMISSAIILCMAFVFSDFSKAQSSFDKSKLIGTWELCDASGKTIETGNVRYKIISSNSFVVVETDQKNHFYSGDFMGSYTIDNDTYVETISFTIPTLYKYKGIKSSFKIELKGDLMYTKGINNFYNEIWKKVDKLTEETK